MSGNYLLPVTTQALATKCDITLGENVVYTATTTKATHWSEHELQIHIFYNTILHVVPAYNSIYV